MNVKNKILGGGAAVLVAFALLTTDFTQPDPGASPFTRASPVPTADPRKKHVVEFDVSWAPNRPVDIGWHVGGDSDDHTQTGSPWWRRHTANPGDTLSVAAFERRGVFPENRIIICKMRVDDVEVRHVEGTRRCLARFVIPVT